MGDACGQRPWKAGETPAPRRAMGEMTTQQTPPAAPPC